MPKITDLPVASTIASSDLLPIVQDGITKQATTGLLPTGGVEHEIMFSTLSGVSDDDKLTTFMNTYRNATFKGPVLVLDAVRTYSFSVQQTLYSGFAIRAAHRPQDQARSSLPVGNRINLSISGGTAASPKAWFKLPTSDLFGVAMTNLALDGNSSSLLVEQTGSTVLWTSVFRDISCQNLAGVLGTKANKLLVTACCIDGWWNVNNVRQRAFQFGGSDFFFQPSMLLLDSPPALLADTEFLFGLNWQRNTWVDNIYCTAEGHSGFLLEGGSDSYSVWLRSCVIEGRNADQPCKGSLIRVNGGQYILQDLRLAFAMTDPAATGRNDSGVIHHAGGTLSVSSCTYQRATGVAESVPFIYASAGTLRVRDIVKQGTWSGKPIVRAANAVDLDADSSVTVERF